MTRILQALSKLTKTWKEKEMNTILEAKNISFYFGEKDKSTPIINNLNLSVEQGEFVAIMGASGSGKSTILQVISGLERSKSGEVVLLNKNLVHGSHGSIKKLYRKNVSFVFQDAHLIPGLSALDNVGMAANLAGTGKGRELSQEWLDQLKVGNISKHYPSELSGGQRQRVALATALVKSPDIIFADEPTSALDAESTEMIIMHLKNFSKDGGTVIAVTHDDRVAQEASKVYWLEGGQLHLHREAGVL